MHDDSQAIHHVHEKDGRALRVFRRVIIIKRKSKNKTAVGAARAGVALMLYKPKRRPCGRHNTSSGRVAASLLRSIARVRRAETVYRFVRRTRERTTKGFRPRQETARENAGKTFISDSEHFFFGPQQSARENTRNIGPHPPDRCTRGFCF